MGVSLTVYPIKFEQVTRITCYDYLCFNRDYALFDLIKAFAQPPTGKNG